MGTKIITLDPRFSTGEPTVQLVATPGRNGRVIHERTSLHMSKTASQSPAMDYIRTVEPQPGKTIVLVIGLGDQETYGPNRNGDGFPSEPVPGKISADEVLTKHYKTYENAHVFEHHVNHDPAKAIGRVLKAFWNSLMRRVEVLEDFDHEKAPHLLERVTGGEFPSKSMGCGPAGTPILTPTGFRAIETLVVGDAVITHTGRPKLITELHVRPYSGYLCTVVTATGASTMTADHPYAVPSADGSHVHWVPAETLRPGEPVLTRIDGSMVFVPVLTVMRSTHDDDVYNFEVEDDHSYIANVHAVHNCKIPFDVCSVCSNKAPTRKQYCEHLLFEMNKIHGDGKQVFAMNPSPKFFDSSWVIRPADRTGHMIKKVAYDAPYEISSSYLLNEQVADLRAKSAALGKAADMEKVISGSPEATSTSTDKGSLKLLKNYKDHVAPGEAKSLPPSDVRVTIEYTPNDAVGTTDAMGIPMGLKDLIKFFMGRMGADEPTEDDLDCACKHASTVLELFAEYPRFYDDALKMAGLTALSVNEKLANTLWNPTTVGDRSLQDTPLYNRRLPANLASPSPNTDVLTFTDPAGRTMRTNMGQARRTTDALSSDAQARKYVRGAGHLGLGTVLGTAGLGALLTGGRSPLRRVAGGLGVAAGVASGIKGMHEIGRDVRVSDLDGPKIMTNEGVVIPAYTQMKSAAWQPDMLYAVLRERDGSSACGTLGARRAHAVHTKCASAVVEDEQSALLGPTLSIEKVALFLEQSIFTLA